MLKQILKPICLSLLVICIAASSFLVLPAKPVQAADGFDLLWHTYWGSGDTDFTWGIAMDSSGNLYVVGRSAATWGSPVSPYTGYTDAFVAKFSSSGDLIWNTFLGGSSSDQGRSIAVDGSGKVFITGFSDATWGSPLVGHHGDHDAFVARLDSSTGTLEWNTFMGSSNTDYGYGIALDSSSNIYIAGSSFASWGTPHTAHAGLFDAFAAKLDGNGNLLWHTFMGSGSTDYGYDVCVDGSGNPIIAGYSLDDWGDACIPHSAGSNYDDFVAKLVSSNGSIAWSNFLGGTDNVTYDYGIAVTTGNDGNVYVAGLSLGTWGSPLRPYEDNYDIFVAALPEDGLSLLWNTFLGGDSTEFYPDITVFDGNLYVTGSSASTTWGNPDQGNAGNYDAFPAKLSMSGELLWNTFIGGTSTEYHGGIVVDEQNNIYLLRDSVAPFGTPLHAYSGSYDIMLAKYVPRCCSLDPEGCISCLIGDKDQEGATGDYPISEHEDDEDMDGFDMHMDGRTIEYTHFVSYDCVIDTVTLNLAIVGFNDQDPDLDNRLFIDGDEVLGAFEGSNDGWQLFTFDIDPAYLEDGRLDVAVAAHDHYLGNDRTEGWGGIDYSELVVCCKEETSGLDFSKTWEDLNGGDVEPGDTVRYTISYTNKYMVPLNAYIIDDFDESLIGIEQIDLTESHFADYLYNADTLRWPKTDYASIPAGESGSVSYTAAINEDISVETDIENEACIYYQVIEQNNHLEAVTQNGNGLVEEWSELCGSAIITVKVEEAAPVVVRKPKPFLDDGAVSPSMSTQTWAKPADTKILTASVQPSQVIAGDPVKIMANIANRGDLSGSYTAQLMINGQVEDTKQLTVPGNGALPIEFTVAKDKPGTYKVDINGQKAYFTVVGSHSGTNPTTIVYTILGALVFVAIILGILFVLRRSNSR